MAAAFLLKETFSKDPAKPPVDGDARMLASLPLFVFPFCLLAAAITDIRRFIIPNFVSVILIAAFFVAFAMSGLGWDMLRVHLLTGAIMLAVGFGMFAYNICGAGDSKLLTSVALWLGWPVFGTALIYITLLGGVLSLGIVMARRFARMFPRLSLIFPPLGRLAATEKLAAPYGVAISTGAMLAFHESPLFKAIISTL